MYARANRRAVLLGLLGGGVAVAMQSYVDLAGPAVAEASPIPGVPDGVIPDGLLPAPPPPLPPDTAAIAAKYAGAVPHEWGVAVTGTATRLAAAEHRIALTFDACGGPQGDGVDADLLGLLERERLPATLFVNGRWIDANPGLTAQLAGNPLVELANHGTPHLPLSVTGKSAYGIAGTTSPAEVIDEVWVNHNRLLEIMGRPPRWFRPGTAHCDEVAASIVRDLGEQVVGFTVNGDAGPPCRREGAGRGHLGGRRFRGDHARQPPGGCDRGGSRCCCAATAFGGRRVRHPQRCRKPGLIRLSAELWASVHGRGTAADRSPGARVPSDCSTMAAFPWFGRRMLDDYLGTVAARSLPSTVPATAYD
ncbi:polysaccharide deacetylase family protein [Rhodococcus koreensis]|uniref:polysaccharide deacetylase family protein n=1 Tax=Rhodococcus koreensis TaxID=99653 RepID=UPI0036D8DF5F